jgi:hypothetical protein
MRAVSVDRGEIERLAQQVLPQSDPHGRGYDRRPRTSVINGLTTVSTSVRTAAGTDGFFASRWIVASFVAAALTSRALFRGFRSAAAA